MLLYSVTDQRNAVTQIPEMLWLSSQSGSDFLVNIADVERVPDVASGKVPAVSAVPFGDLFRRDSTVVGEERLCNFSCALDLNVEIDLAFGVITEDLAMQIPQIDNLIVHQVIIEVMLTDFFL